MDPLSIAPAASSLVFSVVRNGKALAAIFEKYQDAQRCLFLIQTECTVLAAALSQLQMVFSNVSKPGMSRYPEYVVEAVDLSLVGCTLTMSVLSKEVDSLVESFDDNAAHMTKGKRVKYLWKEESMNELLQQLRGQSSALSLLLKALDSSTIEQILTIVQSGRPTFQKVRDGAESIRLAHPQERYAESIKDLTFDDTQSLYDLDISHDEGINSVASKLESSTLGGRSTPSHVGDTLPGKWNSGYSAEHNQRIPETLNHAAEDIDFTPWKLNSSTKFQAALDNIRREASVPALSVGVVSVDSPPKIYVSGNRKQGCPSPVTRADCFAICNTDIFTSTVLAILIDRGIFRWEESIRELFPSLSSRTHPFHHQTTLCMLGAHNSGLNSSLYSVENGDLFRYLRQVDARKGRFAVAVSYLGRPPDENPGTTWYWNSANPILVALAIEERTSRSLESLVKELILDPLEMYSARSGQAGTAKNASLPNNPTQPWGHDGSTKSPMSPTDVNLDQPPALSACTGLYCSAPDYASFVSMHLRAAMGMPTQVPRSDSVSRMYTRLLETNSTPGSWRIASRDWAKGEALLHAGNGDGFGIRSWLAPLDGKAYFAIVNVDGAAGSKIMSDAIDLAVSHATG